MIAVNYCPNCNSREKKHLYRVPDRHYGIKGLYDFSTCLNCSLLFLDPMPNDEELMSFYPEESYYSYHVNYDPEVKWKEVLRKLLFLNSKTKDPVFKRPGAMLDIGCGNGWFIYKMKNLGWNVKGVEPSKAGAEAGRRIGGLDIHHGDLLTANYPSDSFDYIRSNHSFEHISNPNEVLDEIYRILKPGGKVFIGVPNINSYTGNLFKGYWYYLGAPVHTFNYSNRNLSSLLAKHNFKNIKVNFNSNYNGILGSLQIFLNRNNGKMSNEGFIINFFPFRIFAGFLSKISNLLKKGDCIEVIFEK